MVILEMEELAKVSLVISIYLYSFKKMLDGVYYTHFEITGGPCNLIGSNWCDLLTNRNIFCFKSDLFPANEKATLNTKLPIRFQGFFKENNQIAGKWKKKSIVANFATFVSKTVISPLPPQ